MNPQPLLCPFIGISIYEEDYTKVKGLLPTPSYRAFLYGVKYKKIVLIYAIEGYIISSNQYRWISNIKLGLKNYLCVPFEYEENFYINENTEINATLYPIKELSKAFNAPLFMYPKIMYPSTKKELYRALCWYAKRLIHQECFTLEAIIATALLMNAKLQDPYSYKDLHKKALGAYTFIEENKEKCSIRLDNKQLKEAQAKGAKRTNHKQREKTKRKIDELLKDKCYFKANGKVNKTRLANSLGMHRRSLDTYLKDYVPI